MPPPFPVGPMTYNVFGGTLNLAQFNSIPVGPGGARPLVKSWSAPAAIRDEMTATKVAGDQIGLQILQSWGEWGTHHAIPPGPTGKGHF